MYTPYLGRKSCPPSLPLAPRLVEADDAAQALQDHLTHVWQGLQAGNLTPPEVPPHRRLDLLADDEEALLKHADGDQVFTSRDADPHRGRWQFGLRRERRRSLPWDGAREE